MSNAPREPRTPHPATSRRTPDLALARLAASRARERGWRVHGTLSQRPGELRILATVPEHPFPVVACLRAGATAVEEGAREEAARRESRSEHVVGVLGHAVAADRMRDARGGERVSERLEVLILEHAHGGTLADLIARRRMIRADEAATILIGVAAGLGALHEAGWATGSFGADGVVFRRDGCPAVDALHDVRPLSDRGADNDRWAYRSVAEQLCAAVPSPASWRLLDAVDTALAPSGAGAAAVPWEGVIAAVLAVAEAGVVRVTGAPDELRAAPGGSPTPLSPDRPTIPVPSPARPESLAARSSPPRTTAELLDAGLRGVRSRSRPDLGASVVVGPGPPAGSRSDAERGAARSAAALRPVESPSGSARLTASAGEPAFRPVSEPEHLAAIRPLEPRPEHSFRPESALGPVSAFEPTAALTDVLLDGRPLAHLTDRVRAWLRTRRKLVLLALAPVVAAGVALLLIPGSSGGSTASPTPTDSSSAGSTPAGSIPTGSPSAGSTPTGSPPTGSPSGGSKPAVSDASKASSASTVPAEPVAAASALLLARHACFAARERAVTCLSDIVQAGSPLAESDRAALASARSADELDYAGAAVELMQTWGDAALVSVAPDRARTPKSEPASLLMVRSEAGWRLREVFP